MNEYCGIELEVFLVIDDADRCLLFTKIEMEKYFGEFVVAKVSVDNNCRNLGAELEPFGVEYIDTEICV